MQVSTGVFQPSYKGYHIWLGAMEAPYAPSEIKIQVGSRNETVSLINGEELNILKSPSLTTVEFDITLPRGRQYPFAQQYVAPEIFIEYFNKILSNKTPIQLVITRPNPSLYRQNFSSPYPTFGTKENDFYYNDLMVSLEGYTHKESADNAFDIVVSLKFKRYVQYGTIKKTFLNNNYGSVEVPQTPEKTPDEAQKYTVRSGDTLSHISKAYYGTAYKWREIYNANKDVIEKAAKEHGKSSSYKGSEPGWWIFPGTELVIPAL